MRRLHAVDAAPRDVIELACSPWVVLAVEREADVPMVRLTVRSSNDGHEASVRLYAGAALDFYLKR